VTARFDEDDLLAMCFGGGGAKGRAVANHAARCCADGASVCERFHHPDEL
jgi:hypothetical protein